MRAQGRICRRLMRLTDAELIGKSSVQTEEWIYRGAADECGTYSVTELHAGADADLPQIDAADGYGAYRQ